VTVVSADWVVPVEGPPIRRGAVAIGDDGTIAAVGSIDELGEGDRYRNAVILPGFVNAHSHLEYAVYGGFGDGLPFSDWIGLHVQRKRLIDLADMEAIARLGALDCLRSGITTVGDCSFSGAAATACADLGLGAETEEEVQQHRVGAVELDEPHRHGELEVLAVDADVPDRVRLDRALGPDLDARFERSEAPFAEDPGRYVGHVARVAP